MSSSAGGICPCCGGPMPGGMNSAMMGLTGQPMGDEPEMLGGPMGGIGMGPPPMMGGMPPMGGGGY